ncbi:hypothetical protein MMC11_001213 [Xylographa trunciseda]|nr:hypothetical protein [Xylographa trunciseda]
MNEISARCGCKFTFCVNEGALIRWPDGSKQRLWRDPSNPHVDVIWGKRHPPEARSEHTIRASGHQAARANDSGSLKRKASTQLPLDPQITAQTRLDPTLTEHAHVQHGYRFGSANTAQPNLDRTPTEEAHVQQGYRSNHPVMARANLNTTLTDDPRVEEGYEFRGETDQTVSQNPMPVDDGLEYPPEDPPWYDQWVLGDDGDLHYVGTANADPPDDEPHLRGGGGDQERKARGSGRRSNGRNPLERRLRDLYSNQNDDHDEVRIVEEYSEGEEPEIIPERPANDEAFPQDQTSRIGSSPPSYTETHQAGGHPQSTTSQDHTNNRSNSTLESVESHLTDPNPSEAWPSRSEEDRRRLDESARGQQHIEANKVWTKNGKPVRRHVRRQLGTERLRPGLALGQPNLAGTDPRLHTPSARYRHSLWEPPHGGYHFHHPGYFQHRQLMRRAEPLVPLHEIRRLLGRRRREREFQGRNQIGPPQWLHRNRVAYMFGFAIFLFVLILSNSVSWPQLLLVFLIATAAIWLMED